MTMLLLNTVTSRSIPFDTVRVIQYYPPGIQQMIYPSKLAHAESTIDSHTLSADSPNLLFQYSIEFCLPVHLSKVGAFFFLSSSNEMLQPKYQ